jgi:peptidoglycan hydrolase-like protein with peptidoglycan-binding domain
MNAGIIRKAIIAAAVSLSVATVSTSITATPVAAQSASAKSASLPKMGESGPEVTRMQQAIVARGFTIKGGIDGSFGSATQVALKSLQKVAGFAPTGKLDAKTAKFLGLVDVAPLSKSNFPTVGSSGDAVWSLQQALINSGVQVKGGADGKFGLATSIALGRFQAMKGLSVTKSVDESTAIALGLLAAPAPAPKSTGKKTVAAASAPVVAPVVAAAPATSSPITIDSLPVRGQKSENVRILQNALINAGIEVKGGADGVFGVATSVSIGKFQSALGLNVTTALDAPTAAALGLIPTLAELGLPTLQAFPMQGRCSFSDTWHAPRGGGRLHEGVDIIGARGLAIYAVVDGTITRMLSGGALSGNSIRLTAPDGTYFFYAHLDGFAAGLATGQTVRAGQVIGYNGSTGATTAHLHFEIHPQGGAAVNPYPIVKAVDACNVTELLPQP